MSTSLPQYSPPKSGILSYIPASWVPYGELTRIDRPTGLYLFYAPHLFGTLYATSIDTKEIDVFDLISKNVVLLTGTLFFRSAACTWNDNLDREYDRQVLRCRLRPLARGAVSPNQAHVFTVFLTGLALSCFHFLPETCWFVSIPSILLLALYPFAKRFTDFPQVILGVQVAIGFFMGLSAINPYIIWHPVHGFFVTEREQSIGALIAFYAANACWTIVYDTIYAQQDVEDDSKAGVRSMAVRFRNHTKFLLWTVSTMQIIFLVLAGYLQHFGRSYMVIACSGTMTSLAYMITTIDLNNPVECLWWFKSGFWFVTTCISVGLGMESLGVR